ncbi:MAG: metallophosphoesterase family protein [Salinivenus sp.]
MRYMSSRTDVVVDSTVSTADTLSPIEFAPAIENQHVRVDPSDWADIYVVGDVHGCIDELEQMLDELAITEDDLVLFVGDLVRKGPDSQAVVDRVRSTENMMTIRGNNEQKIIDGTADPGLDDDAKDYIASLPLAISVGQNLLVHGGIDIEKALTDQTEDDLLEHRYVSDADEAAATYWFERHDELPRVFFGHTVLDAPFVTDHAVGLDTGCVHGHGLSVYNLTTETLYQITSEEYKHRSEDSTVSTDDLVY